MGEELLKGEQMAHQSFDGQRLERLLPVEDVEAVPLGMHLQAEAVTDELAGDVILLEIDLDHTMGIDLALHVPAIQPVQPAIRIDDLGQGTQGRQSRKGRARGLVAAGQCLVGPLEVVVLAEVLGHLAGLLQGGRLFDAQTFCLVAAVVALPEGVLLGGAVARRRARRCPGKRKSGALPRENHCPRGCRPNADRGPASSSAESHTAAMARRELGGPLQP